jgi:hypothetical protein
VLAEADLPAIAHVLDGKRVDGTPHPVRITGIGRDAVELLARFELPAACTDLKLHLDFGDGAPGEGSYVRIAAREAGPTGFRIRAVFTSLPESDRARLARLIGSGASSQMR